MDRVYLALDLLGQPLRREQEGVDVVLQLREARRADNDRSVRGHLVVDRGEPLSWEQAGPPPEATASSQAAGAVLRRVWEQRGPLGATGRADGAVSSSRGDGAFHQRGDEASRAAPQDCKLARGQARTRRDGAVRVRLPVASATPSF